jgi:hypothetical protein
MAYVGNNLTIQQYAPQIAYFSGNASTTAFTLPQAVVTAAQILVFVANVPQNPSSAYTVSGTTLTFTSAPPTGTNNIWVEYTSLQTNTVVPSPGTVQSSSFASGASEFATGTAILFQQTAAPTGWTKVTTYDNYALRIISGTVGTGGTVAFTTAFSSKSVTGTIGATTLTTAQIPVHSHGASNTGNTSINHSHNMSPAPVTANQAFIIGSGGQVTFGDTSGVNNTGNSDPTHAHGGSGSTGNAGSGSSHDHTFTGTAINLAVQYVDAIICTKS